jgi:hypothetical protein
MVIKRDRHWGKQLDTQGVVQALKEFADNGKWSLGLQREVMGSVRESQLFLGGGGGEGGGPPGSGGSGDPRVHTGGGGGGSLLTR